MSRPSRPVPVPDQQRVAFGLALAEYLGIDATKFALIGWEARGGTAEVRLKTFLPEEDLLYMFNSGKVPK